MSNFKSAGLLTVGEPQFDKASGVFSVDFMFVAHSGVMGEAEMVSATMMVAQKTDELLKMNGFWHLNRSKPQTRITPMDKKTVHFMVAVKLDASTTPYVVKLDS